MAYFPSIRTIQIDAERVHSEKVKINGKDVEVLIDKIIDRLVTAEEKLAYFENQVSEFPGRLNSLENRVSTLESVVFPPEEGTVNTASVSQSGSNTASKVTKKKV
jgi:hypothetical protein